MPIHRYRCSGCGHEFWEIVRRRERPSCPECGGAVKRLWPPKRLTVFYRGKGFHGRRKK